jgi:hypothetical protein
MLEIKITNPMAMVDGYLRFQFSAEVDASIECRDDNREKVIHTTTVSNPTAGNQAFRLEITYTIEEHPEAALCAHRLVSACSRSREFTLPMPNAPQEYLYLPVPEKRTQVRACIPTPSNAKDFTVTCSVSGIIASRDGVLRKNVAVNSSMHVLIL